MGDLVFRRAIRLREKRPDRGRGKKGAAVEDPADQKRVVRGLLKLTTEKKKGPSLGEKRLFLGKKNPV